MRGFIRDFPMLIWRPRGDGPSARGRVSPPEASEVRSVATTVAFLTAGLVRTVLFGSPLGSWLCWVAGLSSFALTLLAGYFYYRTSGPEGG